MPGYIDAFFYVLFTAVSFTFIDKLDDHINPYISLLCLTIFATIFFNAINYKNLKTMYMGCLNNKSLYLGITLCIGVNWLCSIFAPNQSDPFIYLALSFITMAICGFVFIKKNNKQDYYVHYGCILVFIIMIIFIHRYYEIGKNRSLNFGIIIGIISGLSGYLYGYISNSFAKKASLNATQVLGVRFWLLIIMLIIVVLSQHLNLNVIKENLGVLFLMSLLSMIVPNYFNQSSLIKLGVTRRAIFVVITPGITFLIYSISAMRFDKINFIIALITTLVMIFSKILPLLINHVIKRLV